MISCLIVDDEPLAVQLLENHIQLTPWLQLAHVCFHSLEAIEWLAQHPVDLIFLDINMPYLSGMQLKDMLPEEQKVIFTTAYSEFAVASYEKNAVDYLLKPITFDRFLKAAMKVRKTVADPLPSTTQATDDYIYIKSGKDYLKVAYKDILYIEALKDYVLVVTSEARIIAYKRLKELAQSLPSQFCRVHLSYIINQQHISKIADNHIWIGSQSIPLSDTYRQSFMLRITERKW